MTFKRTPISQFDPFEAIGSEDREVPDEIPRDGYGRPLIAPVGVSPADCVKPKRKREKDVNYFTPYTRCSTMAKALDDQVAIEGWRARKAIKGVALRTDLQMEILAVDEEDSKEGKRDMNAAVETAMEISGANNRRRRGSALHKFSERWDKRKPIGFMPDEHLDDMKAYISSTFGFTMQHIERFVVNDRDQCAGTPDRICNGKISDLKTGNDVLQYGQLSIAMQLANYADSSFYNFETGERTPFEVDPDTGIVWHLPAGEGVCHWYEVDLNIGREGIAEAKRIREMRKVKGVFTLVDSAPSSDVIHMLIDDAGNLDRCRELSVIFDREWTEEHTSHAVDLYRTA